MTLRAELGARLYQESFFVLVVMDRMTTQAGDFARIVFGLRILFMASETVFTDYIR